MGRFQRVRMEGDLALFRWSGKAHSSPVFGLRKDAARAQPSMPTLKEFWEKDTASAIVISASEPPGDLSAWASYIGFSSQSEDNMVAWLEAPSTLLAPDADFRRLRINRRTGQLNTQSGFNLGVLQITVEGDRAGSPVVASWDFDAVTLSLTGASLHAVRLDNRQPAATISPSASITLCLDGDQAGALMFRLVDQDAYLLFGLLGDPSPPGHPPPKRAMPEVRYFYPGGKLSFPMAEPISAGKPLTAVVSLNPALPFSAFDTYFKPDLSQQAMLDLFTCTSVTQTNGHRATLVPADDFGFHLAAAPNCYKNRWRHFYPAPFGPMRVTTNGEIKLMCGLSGYEYLQLGEGAAVALVPNQNAYAAHFDPPSARARGDPHCGGTAADTLLSGLGQTSWLSIRTPGKYYSQSDVEPFFAAGINLEAAYPSAVLSYLNDPSFVSGAAPPAFPFAPHAAVYDQSHSNANVALEVFAAYEAQVLVQQRYQLLVSKNAALVFRGYTDVPLDKDSGRSREIATPAAGTWRFLSLAGHPEKGIHYAPASREVGDTGSVKPNLSEALLRPGAFLVANNWGALGDSFSELVADGFVFRVKPAPETDADPPIAIFKFQTTASLEELIRTPSFWCNPADWVVGGSDGIQKAQDTVRKAIGIANATKESTDPYDYFRSTIAHDPKWSGVVIFNVPIAACDVPPDFQVLFAGIDGRLCAHHVGFQQNQPTFTAGGNSALKLFGVIHYQSTHLPAANPAPPAAGWGKFAFTVLDWAIGIENSLVNSFDALVAITIPELFDRQVSFTDPELEALAKDTPGIELRANTLVMRGVYQRLGQAGSAGTLAFQRRDPLTIPIFKVGDLKRVIDHAQITSAVLTPGVATGASAKSPASPAAGSDQNREVQARLSLRGQLCFSPNPFGVTAPADLFSFGKLDASGSVVGPGLEFDEFRLKISFALDQNGERAGDATIEADYSRIQVRESREGIRPKSLLASFPLKVTRLVRAATEAEFTPTSLAAIPMNVVNIKDDEGVSPVAAVVPTKDNDGAKPIKGLAAYALECDLPLGTLGALAGPQADISAKILLGWGPSLATPDNDAAQMMVRLLNLSAPGGFNLQGIIQVGFKDANLSYMPKSDTDPEHVYVILFNNVALKILGMTLPPNVLANFLLMGADTDPAQQNVAWYLAVAQTCDEKPNGDGR